MITIQTPDFIFGDDRGLLVQLVHDGYNQINMCFSKAGTQRGNHYHEINRETFYVISGEMKITAEKNGESVEKTFKTGDMFTVETGVMHSINYITDTYLTVMYDKGVELPDGTKDIIGS